MLFKRSSDITSFVEHPVYSILKSYNILILDFLFWFANIYSKCMWKSHFEILGTPQFYSFSAILLILLWSTLYIAISKFYSLPLLIQIVCVKGNFLKNLSYSAKGAVILLFSWSSLYIEHWKCVVSWCWFFHVDFPLITGRACVKFIFYWKFRCSAKETVLFSFMEHPVCNNFKMYSFWI